MALNQYLTLKGQKQGDIKGSVTQKGRENSIMVIALSHEIVSPRDPASGMPSGKRMHKPFVITKELDKSSPLLYSMLCNNENITEWHLNFWQPSVSGQEKNHFRVDLVNASISAIAFRSLNNKNPDLMKYNEFEEIAFVYQKITWTWLDGGITADDDWEAPNA